MEFTTLDEIKIELNNGSLSCEKLVQHYLQNINARKNLNAFIEVYDKEAIARAQQVDQKIQNKTAGRLAGMVIGLKDNLCFKDHGLTASSKILNDFESLFSGTAVERLLKEDAIIIGRLNCDEFAMGSSNEFSTYGPVLNPVNETKVPGGSSGGSATAVAANLCLATLGSDTGGSIRQPASFCGVVGFKPSYGRISRHGLIAYGSSFDQIGPFSHSVKDTALMYEIMAGADEFDSTLSRKKIETSNFDSSVSTPKKIGYLKECLDSDKLDPEIRQEVNTLIEKLKSEGHTVEPVSSPYLDYLVPVYYVLTTAEASSNLARYDGVHYGYRSPNATDLESTYKLSRTEGFGNEVKRRIVLGTFVLSSGYYDAYYTQAQKARRLIQDQTNEVFQKFDFILSPTTPGTAFDIGREKTDPTVMYLEDIFTVQANICGIPAISLPIGQHSNGMPFGIQLMAAKFAEKELLEFSDELMNKA